MTDSRLQMALKEAMIQPATAAIGRISCHHASKREACEMISKNVHMLPLISMSAFTYGMRQY